MKKVLLILLLGIFSVIFFGCEKEYLRITYPYPEDVRMWREFFEVEEPYEFESAPLGAILPHHMIVGYELANFYEGLSKVSDPSVIVVMGPNHYENGLANIQTCKNCLFTSTEGDVEIEDDLVEDLVDDDIAVYLDETFIKEHAIFSHTPHIRHYFPNAKIVPLLLQWKIPIDEVHRLSEWLDKNLPEDALVIASVDFSHYMPPEVADFHDQSSFTTISNFDFQNIYDLEIDSPSSIYALLDLMRKRGYMKAERLAHTNMYQFLTEHVEETTSHQFFAFYKGEVEPVEGVSILSFGNVPDDNILTFMNGWFWDRNYDERTDYTTTKQLRDIKGGEDRFLTGSDFYVFDLVDDECFSETQNGMKVAFCKFTEDAEREKEFLNTIKEQEADLVYLLFEFKGSELDYDQKDLVRDFVRKGVDIFVGRGIEEIIPFETYRGSLLFYSLGDFIIDNKLITDLNALSSGMVLGLYITPENYYIYTFPVVITNGYPELTDFSKRPILFNIFRDAITLSHRDEADAVKGVIRIKR